MERKVIQIVCDSGSGIIGLCNDGTILLLSYTASLIWEWEVVDAKVPQG